MRRAIVHFGLPRTGTTSFQRAMHDLRGELLACGVLYPAITPRSAAHEPHLNHQHLGEALDGRRPRAERDELLGRLGALLRNTDADAVLISYEGLWHRPRPDLWRAGAIARRLAGLFAAHGFTMEAAMTVKPQAEYLNSDYTLRLQWLLEGRAFAPYLEAQFGRRFLDYGALLRPWARACAGRAHVVPLRDAVDPTPFIPRLLGAMGLAERLRAPLAGCEARRENPSPGPVAAEAMRRLHGLRPAARRPVTRFIEEHARETGLDRTGFQGMSADLAARVEAHHAAGNEALARACWGTGWRARVIGASMAVSNEIAAEPAGPEPEAMVRSVLRACRERFGLDRDRGPSMWSVLRNGWLRPRGALR